MKLTDLEAYEILEQCPLRDLKSEGFILRHKKSGARIAVISNDDDNKVFYIGFRTPAEDSTGVPHIIEHTVLCGSDKYPVKDPFVELVKGSLNTFLNAITYPEKTIYPVASCNDTDFQNLMSVYMDALQHSVHRRAGLDHQQDLPGLFQNGAELLQRGTAGDGVARRLTSLHKDLRGLAAAVVARHGKAVLCQVQCQAPAHDRQARNADLILHALSSFKNCPCFQPLSNQTK